MKDLPRWVRPLALTITVLALLPLVLIGRARLVPKSSPRIHLIQDMDAQPKYGPQAASPLFADGRAMRPPVAGTVEHGAVVDDPALTTGWVGDRWIETMPVSVDETLLRRGRERFDIYCAPCHGLSGYGDGPVSKRAEALAEGTWVIPSSLYADQSRSLPAGQLFGTITSGVRNMPAYGAQIGVHDRWAIVAHVQALQRSQPTSGVDQRVALE
ncbi:MAG: cytochrome c [Thermoanaerobaculaceae bacterium]|nr:cytochrome c [Thermoanaerobaculaceae bacterium]MDI9622040.1 cytochrome c [Acidobacteriota bacterium]NLH09761.1 cytochrome c [Holophagae bacterium]HPW54830.1 cytochrome c [Thermoanaerobaculaceae bacterium]